MSSQLRGLATVVVAGATAVCGILMLGGVGPATGGAPLTGDRLPLVAATTSTTAPDATPITISGEVATTTTATSNTVDGSTTGSGDTTSTSSTSEVTSTSTAPTEPSPVPVSVTASNGMVGPGGSVEFSGRCPVAGGQPLGPVIVWMISDTTDVVDTGITAADWVYEWVAPTDPALIRSYAVQFWCGDPAGWQGGYPAELQLTIDIVAQAAPPATTSPLIESDSSTDPIPQTG
jgi:hypothetical protein